MYWQILFKSTFEIQRYLSQVYPIFADRIKGSTPTRKLGIKGSNLCGMCRLEVYSVEHILLYCEHTKETVE